MLARIKSTICLGKIYIGTEVDAVISPCGDGMAIAFDEDGVYWTFSAGNYAIIEPVTTGKIEGNGTGQITTTPSDKTINDFFSQEMSEMTVRFK